MRHHTRREPRGALQVLPRGPARRGNLQQQPSSAARRTPGLRRETWATHFVLCCEVATEGVARSDSARLKERSALFCDPEGVGQAETDYAFRRDRNALVAGKNGSRGARAGA
jgi:hypothetical protein